MRMKKLLLVGLGNPGKKFAGTRHNLGIDILRAWVRRQDSSVSWRSENKFQSDIVQMRSDQLSVDCLFPTTFMNESGKAVQAYVQFYSIAHEDILLIHDELELSLGEVVIKPGGSAHGHNGIRSIQTALGTDQLARLRLGIGRPGEMVPVERYVLERFSEEEQAVIEEYTIPRACDLLDVLVESSPV